MIYEIIAVGKIKESFIREGILEFEKRLSRFAKLIITEVKDTENIEEESKRISEKLPKGAFIVLLDISGKMMGSEGFSEFLGELKFKGFSRIVFIIGGSRGVSEGLRSCVDFRLSFSKMTFPHQLMRLIFLEQLYRAEAIQNGLPYHK